MFFDVNVCFRKAYIQALILFGMGRLNPNMHLGPYALRPIIMHLGPYTQSSGLEGGSDPFVLLRYT